MRIVFVFSLILLTVFWVSTPKVYSLSYSYFDEIAQAYCASRTVGWAWAIRRQGRKGQFYLPTCEEVCQSAKKGIMKQTHIFFFHITCFDAIYVKKDHPKLATSPSVYQPDAKKVGMITYSHGPGGCEILFNIKYLPNFCCCKPHFKNLKKARADRS